MRAPGQGHGKGAIRGLAAPSLGPTVCPPTGHEGLPIALVLEAGRKSAPTARAANAELRPCWTCRGSIGGTTGSKLELTEKAGPDRLECPQCAADRERQELRPLVLPAPTKREQMAALVFAPDDPWWEVRMLHTRLYPLRDRAA
ncbi:hypothetical protein [Kitasatospora mediocidica]|uniref:hypothetical protein n=1 Tax=Kitasatospora mediocidica TaxID=58352 RepID=UPI00055C01F3|nr:hypothetical protein [Kitasatospora mediocidica]